MASGLAIIPEELRSLGRAAEVSTGLPESGGAASKSSSTTTSPMTGTPNDTIFIPPLGSASRMLIQADQRSFPQEPP